MNLFSKCYSTISNKGQLIYSSPNIGLIKLVKTFSLSTLGASALATPALLYFWQEPIAHAADLTNAMFLGAFAASGCSTGALTYLLSPYVNHIYLHSKNNAGITPDTVITIETLDILTRKRQTTVRLRELQPVYSTFLTWKVNPKVIEKEELSDQPKRILQHRFWLDQRNGTGDREIMSKILRIVYDQRRI
ncbi:hypothetical protein G6F70_006632 [Rhizopus microsporus]|nr:hypothetical protein G6F71_006560 [Rhizopus microsporus]KAG1197423.1 hypothetical protein G6F70_006632 [Rhizopus microsporus]KAG1210382.1 hypothetical protein G6F69_005522 [Rhizopus microsporus]KAG1232166.1 hypothetical protein G6F67_005211 [Rhizopus microsporus]KAG1262847.1 hypothetical protein G6F68_005614 [Rhizopus microsporus]